MEHRFNIKGREITIAMGCNHPNMNGNSTESVGCSGNCENCDYSIASCTIPDIFHLIDAAKSD